MAASTTPKHRDCAKHHQRRTSQMICYTRRAGRVWSAQRERGNFPRKASWYRTKRHLATPLARTSLWAPDWAPASSLAGSNGVWPSLQRFIVAEGCCISGWTKRLEPISLSFPVSRYLFTMDLCPYQIYLRTSQRHPCSRKKDIKFQKPCDDLTCVWILWISVIASKISKTRPDSQHLDTTLERLVPIFFQLSFGKDSLSPSLKMPPWLFTAWSCG